MFKVYLFLYLSTIFIDNVLLVNEKKTIDLGSKKCTLNSKGNLKAKCVFLSLHDDENTSIDAYIDVSKKIDNALLIELQQSGLRLVKYGYKGKDYLVDPNRIFTTKGLIATLEKNNKNYPKEIIEPLKKISKEILDLILLKSKNKYIIAIHNNSNDSYSIKSYVNSSDAENLFINPKEDVDNFFYVTNISDFNYFKSKKRNVILQSEKVKDDGSLSVYCHKMGLPYINIETEDGKKEIQKNMIEEAYSYINLY